MIMKPNYEEIGSRIKKIRRQKSITQEKLAEELEMSQIYLSKIERGVVAVNLQRLMEISAILKVSVGSLLEGNTIITIGNRKYVTAEFEEILKKCTEKQQRFIYEVAELVVEMNL